MNLDCPGFWQESCLRVWFDAATSDSSWQNSRWTTDEQPASARGRLSARGLRPLCPQMWQVEDLQKNTGSKSIASRDVSALLDVGMDFRMSPFGMASTHPNFTFTDSIFHIIVLQLYSYTYSIIFSIHSSCRPQPLNIHRCPTRSAWRSWRPKSWPSSRALTPPMPMPRARRSRRRSDRSAARGRRRRCLGVQGLERMGRSGSFVDVFLKLVWRIDKTSDFMFWRYQNVILGAGLGECWGLFRLNLQ